MISKDAALQIAILSRLGVAIRTEQHQTGTLLRMSVRGSSV